MSTAFSRYLADLKKPPIFPLKELCFGEEEFLRFLWIDNAVSHWKSQGLGDCSRLELDRKNIYELVHQLTQVDMFAESRLFVCTIPDTQLGKFLEKLKEGPKTPISHSMIINYFGKKISPKESELAKNCNLQVCQAASPAPFEYASFIQARTQHLGLACSSEVIALLLEHCGQDLLLLENQIQHLRLLFPTASQISKTDVSQHLDFLREDALFQMRNNLLDCKKPQLLSLISDLLKRGESPLAILGFLTKHIRHCIIVAEGLANNSPISRLEQLTQLHPSTLRRYTNLRSVLNLDRLGVAWKRCISADQTLKSKAVSEELVISAIVDLLI